MFDDSNVSRRAVLGGVGAVGVAATGGYGVLQGGPGSSLDGWRQYGSDPGRTWFTSGGNPPADEATVRWRVGPTGAVLTAGDRAYVSAGAVVDLTEGSVLGKSECLESPGAVANTDTYTDGVVVTGTPIDYDGEGPIFDGGGAVHGYRPAAHTHLESDCELSRRWSISDRPGIYGAPTVHVEDGLVYVSDYEEGYVLDADDGRVEQSLSDPAHRLDDTYRYSYRLRFGDGGYGVSSQVITIRRRSDGGKAGEYTFDSNGLFHGVRDGVMYVTDIRRSGEDEEDTRSVFQAIAVGSGVQWSVDVMEVLRARAPIDVDPSHDPDKYSGRLSPPTAPGDPAHHPLYTGAAYSVVAGPETVHAVFGTDLVVGLDATDGTVRWTQPLQGIEAPEIPSLTGTPEALYVCDDTLRCLDPTDGTEQWRFGDAWTPVRSVVHGDLLLVTTRSGEKSTSLRAVGRP